MADRLILDRGHPPPLYTKPGFFKVWLSQLEKKSANKATDEPPPNARGKQDKASSERQQRQ